MSKGTHRWLKGRGGRELSRRPSFVSAFTLALLALGGITSASASAEVINFDDIDAPGPGGSGAFVTQTHGVTFTNAYAFDYGKGSFAIPDFPHSKPVAVEACVAVEFCSSPLTASFTTAQRSVAAWVGYDGPHTSPLSVRLTGLNAAGAVVKKSDPATLPASSTHNLIRTRLAIDLASPTIRKVEVSVINSDGTNGFNAGLAIDDLEYSTASPPPPCEATSAPIVTLRSPEGSPIPLGDPPVVQANAFLLEGKVDLDAKRAPITSATVTATPTTGGGTPHTGTAFPTPIHFDGGDFGPISYGGILSPGENDIVVRATNCFGTGTSYPGQVIYDPLVAGTRFHELGNVEVVQTVQNPYNSVPLIARSGGGIKRTYARVYLKAENGSSLVRDVSGRLTATLPDGSRPPGPISIPSLNRIDVSDATMLQSVRSAAHRSLNFELPPEWLSAGRLHLQLASTSPGLPCVECDNRFPSGAPATVTFHEAPPLRLVLVMAPWKPSTGAETVFPTQVDIDRFGAYLRATYPTAEVQIIEESLEWRIGRPTCRDVNEDLAIASGLYPADPRTRFYGLIGDNGDPDPKFVDGAAGCAPRGGRYGSGFAGSANFGWDFDGSYGDWIAAHEIAHMLGRRHAPSPPDDCNHPEGVDGSFPYPSGLIGDVAHDNVGIEPTSSGLVAHDWRSGAADIMGYCDDYWISDYTYRGILAKLCSEDHANCPDHESLSKFASGARSAAPRRSGGKPRLLLAGSLSLRSGRAELSSVAASRGLRLTKRPRHSAYAIELRGSHGQRLGRFPFRPKPLGERARAAISEVVPFRSTTARILIKKGKRTLAARRVSRHAPRVHVGTARVEGANLSLTWDSSDPDGGRQSYTVLYSDDGRGYFPVATGIRGRSLNVDLGDRPGGPAARIRVIANDGVRTGAATSKPLAVPVKPPHVRIDAPGEGTQVTAGQSLNLVASVLDLQDAPFPSGRIVWRSSLQGELGHGTAISTSLEPGTHEITATATNSGGQSDVARVTVKAVAEPPFFDGGGGAQGIDWGVHS